MNQPSKNDKRKTPGYAAPLAGTLILVLLALTACSTKGGLSTANQAAIYAAVVRQIYQHDDTFGGQLQPPLLFLMQTTDDSIGDPNLPQAEPATIPETVQRRVTRALDDLPTEVTWIEDTDEIPLEETTGDAVGQGALIILGNLHLQEDGSVHVSGSIHVAMLAAGGRTYLVEKVGRTWQVTGHTGSVWMS
jgi:hypothetical protein